MKVTRMLMWLLLFVAQLTMAQSQEELTAQKTIEELKLAILEAQKKQAAAMVPETKATPLAGSITPGTGKFGTLGMVKAFDLASQLADSVCINLQGRATEIVIYDAATFHSMVQAKVIERSITDMEPLLNSAREALLKPAPPAGDRAVQSLGIVEIAVATGALKAVADLTSLFKTNVVVSSDAFGDEVRPLFTAALAEKCAIPATATSPRQPITVYGSGYLGELDTTRYNQLRDDLVKMIKTKYELADAIAAAGKRIEQTPEPEKTRLKALIADATSLLNTANSFIEALKIPDIAATSPLGSVARYLAFFDRTQNAHVFEFQLRLEGVSITEDNFFTGQKLRLSGSAFLWYRLYERNGTAVQSKTVRRLTKPAEINLRWSSADVDGTFWSPDPTAKND